MPLIYYILPGRLMGAMRLVGVEGGKTNVPGMPGEGNAAVMHIIIVKTWLCINTANIVLCLDS